MLYWLVEIQRDIYSALAEHIKLFSTSGDWQGFLLFLPMGVIFGSVHAMTPGHSKALLATYVTGSGSSVRKALFISLILSATHITMSVVIVLFSLPVVRIVFGGGGPGSSPILEDLSRGLLGVIGIWLLLSALFRKEHRHHDEQGWAFAFFAGLIPCPLTLFVMTFAASKGVMEAGLLFAATMLLGVALTLAITALLAVLSRQKVASLMSSRPVLLNRATKGVEIFTAAILLVIALWQFL